MNLSFAPLEGLTYAAYRRLHAAFFPGSDRYYAPFLAPDQEGRVKAAALADLRPERNEGVNLVPQILCNRPEAFLALSRELAAMGYREINLNTGCPSGTVVPKHKGAGMLLDLASLADFLDKVFSETSLRVSVKTRLGVESAEEFSAILEVFNRYPLAELIVHARDRKGMYQSTPDLKTFAPALSRSRAPLCYNGNILNESYARFVMSTFPALPSMMLGRGALADPSLFRQLRGGKRLEKEELFAFLDQLLEAYLASGLGEHYSLGRMKELWYYVNHMFPGADRQLKQLKKASSISDYRVALGVMFSSGCFDAESSFPGSRPKW